MKQVSFKTIPAVILENTNACLTQSAYIEAIFGGISGIIEDDLIPTITNKWITGKRNVTAYICKELCKLENQEVAKERIRKNIIPAVSDIHLLMQQLDSRILSDSGIHRHTKDELIQAKDISEKIAGIIIFAVKRVNNTVSRKWKTPDLREIIYGVKVPSVGYPVIGRERELAELERRIEKERTVYVTGQGGIGKSELVRELCQYYLSVI